VAEEKGFAGLRRYRSRACRPRRLRTLGWLPVRLCPGPAAARGPRAWGPTDAEP